MGPRAFENQLVRPGHVAEALKRRTIMPWVQWKPGISVWEGESTKEEQMEFYRRFSNVGGCGFPSTNHRSALRSRERMQEEEPEQQEELPRST